MPVEYPEERVLQTAAMKIVADFKDQIPTLLKAAPAKLAGRPVVIVFGLGPRPAVLSRAINITMRSGHPYTVAIVWHSVELPPTAAPLAAENRDAPAMDPPTAGDEIPLDQAMWAGSPPIEERPGILLSPGDAAFAVIQGPIPETVEQNFQLAVGARQPQFTSPNFWSVPFDQNGSVCVDRYATWYNAFHLNVPSDRMVIVKGISYQFDNTLIPLDQFEVEVFRSGDRLAAWTDMRALANPDPALEYVFGGHIQQLPFYGRFDHDQNMTVRVRVLGAYPFNHTAADLLGGCFHVYLSGFMASLMDNRDGGARPSDMGDLNQLALGDMVSGVSPDRQF